MVARKGLLAPQNTFLDTIAARFDGTHSNFVLGNARVPKLFPIVYCSDGFCDLSGYPRAYIMQKGCACKFLHGPGTDLDKLVEIEKALEAKTELQVEVQFYRKNGSPFWCLIDLVPITNEKHEVVLYLVSHKDITSNRLSVPGAINTVIEDAPSNFNPNRRRSRAVLYGIQDHYKTNSRTTKLAKINKQGLLNSSLPSHKPLPEYKTAAAKKPKFVFSHYGYLKCLWDVIIIVATIYVAIIVPYNAAFYGTSHDVDNVTLAVEDHFYCPQGGNAPGDRDKRRFSVISVLVELIFVMDILLNFRTTFVNHRGEVVTNSRDITINYIKTWFFLDLVAALPFDFLELFELNLMESFESIHLLKLTRLLRLARLVSKVERYSQYSSLILILLMWSFFLLAHWLACIWYVIAEREMESSIFTSYNRGWMSMLAAQGNYNDTRCVPDSEAYITALYFTTTSLTTVGFGNVAANTKYEKIFAVIIMMIGALMHATIFGHVTNIVHRSFARRSEYDSKWSDLKQFTELHNMPKQLKQRMQDYFQSVWSINNGIDVTEVLSYYPEELRGDLCLHLHKEVLSLALFQAAPQGCLKSISLTIKTSFCAPDEYLVHTGDVVSTIYYISSGSMEVVQDGMVVALLGKGDLVGCDIPLVTPESPNVVKSSADVRALTYCFLEFIQVPQLLQVLRLHTEFRDQFSNDIQHDLTYNLRQGFEQDDEEVLQHRSRLPSISEMSDVSVRSSKSLRTPPTLQASASTVLNTEEARTLKNELGTLLRKLERVTEKTSSLKSAGVGTTSKGVQTDFPVSLLESYVVKNRSRILSLLNIPDPVKTTPDPGCHQVGAISSVSSPLLGNGSASTCTASMYNERKMAVTDF